MVLQAKPSDVRAIGEFDSDSLKAFRSKTPAEEYSAVSRCSQDWSSILALTRFHSANSAKWEWSCRCPESIASPGFVWKYPEWRYSDSGSRYQGWGSRCPA